MYYLVQAWSSKDGALAAEAFGIANANELEERLTLAGFEVRVMPLALETMARKRTAQGREVSVAEAA